VPLRQATKPPTAACAPREPLPGTTAPRKTAPRPPLPPERPLQAECDVHFPDPYPRAGISSTLVGNLAIRETPRRPDMPSNGNAALQLVASNPPVAPGKPDVSVAIGVAVASAACALCVAIEQHSEGRPLSHEVREANGDASAKWSS
jgi:hypothetical protein